MGQKVHPYAFRLGVNKDWKAHWFATKKQYPKFLWEDLKIREYILARFEGTRRSKGEIQRVTADIGDIVIDRVGEERISITIYTPSPGVIIGREGKEVEQLRAELEKLLKRIDKEWGEKPKDRRIYINVREITHPELCAELVAKNIARKIEMRVNHRRAMKQALDRAFRAGAKGMRIQVKGRIGGAEIARKEWYLRGKVPLQTIRADIDYAQATAFTKWGTVGVKVWIYKGDVPKRTALAEESAGG